VKLFVTLTLTRGGQVGETQAKVEVEVEVEKLSFVLRRTNLGRLTTDEHRPEAGRLRLR
jgi:hypothetical protein